MILIRQNHSHTSTAAKTTQSVKIRSLNLSSVELIPPHINQFIKIASPIEVNRNLSASMERKFGFVRSETFTMSPQAS